MTAFDHFDLITAFEVSILFAQVCNAAKLRKPSCAYSYKPLS